MKKTKFFEKLIKALEKFEGKSKQIIMGHFTTLILKKYEHKQC